MVFTVSVKLGKTKARKFEEVLENLHLKATSDPGKALTTVTLKGEREQVELFITIAQAF